MIPNERRDCLFATLMVYMRVGHSNAGLLAVTRDVATRFGSTVIGMAAKQVSAPLAQIRGAGLCESQQHGPRKFAEKAATAEEEFRSALAGVETLEWRTQMTVGPVYDHIANEARVADLVIAPIDRDRFFSSSGQAEIGDLLKSIGRPILATPPGATGLGFDHALVLWKETRESRRAVADALPLLKEMRRVNVVEIVEAAEIELPVGASRTSARGWRGMVLKPTAHPRSRAGLPAPASRRWPNICGPISS